MNQKDWVEYFKAINGRKPTALEFSEALENGLFVLDRKQENESSHIDKQSTTMTEEEWIESFETKNSRKPTPREFSEALSNGEFFSSKGIDLQQEVEGVDFRINKRLVLLSAISLLLIFFRGSILSNIYKTPLSAYFYSFHNWLQIIPILLGLGIGLYGMSTKRLWIKEIRLLRILSVCSILLSGYDLISWVRYNSYFPLVLLSSIVLIIEFIKFAMLCVGGANGDNQQVTEGKSTNFSNFNQPFHDFQFRKRGYWLNFLLVFIDFIFFFILFSLITDNFESPEVMLPLTAISIILSMINLIPTFISHTGWKYLIFIVNIFLGPTIIGWLILLVVAIVTNNNAKREQEMAYLLRKMSDKLGGDQ